MMDFISTRNKQLRSSLTEAIRCGLAQDGGLFVPQSIPKIELSSFTGELSYPLFAEKVLHAFFKGDILERNLLDICHNAFSFPAPLNQLNENTYILELFHGPTLSFKDFGARFLAACLNQIFTERKTTIMVATSGDTGSAVASAFYDKPNVNVIILYPKGLISQRQEQQITCWGNKNIRALAVNGTFDECQKLVKSAFANPTWNKQFALSSANSINIGRLLPQIIYYAYSSMQFYQRHSKAPGYIVPTGNLGNATAGYFAKLMGFPIREIVLATNANKVIEDYLHSGEYQPRTSISTLANAMDVGNPSNFERLHYLFNTFDLMKQNVSAFSVSDIEISRMIQSVYKQYQYMVCPHTATAYFVRQQLSPKPWIITATAHPSKFNQIIEPLINTPIPIPHNLQILLDKPIQVTEVESSLPEIEKVVLSMQ